MSVCLFVAVFVPIDRIFRFMKEKKILIDCLSITQTSKFTIKYFDINGKKKLNSKPDRKIWNDYHVERIVCTQSSVALKILLKE